MALFLEVELRELPTWHTTSTSPSLVVSLVTRREAAGLVEAGDAAQAAAWEFLLCSTFYYYSFLSSLFYRIFFVLSYFSFDYLPLVQISTSVTPIAKFGEEPPHSLLLAICCICSTLAPVICLRRNSKIMVKEQMWQIASTLHGEVFVIVNILFGRSHELSETEVSN